MQFEGLPNSMEEDANIGLRPAKRGRQSKRPPITKRHRTIDRASREEQVVEEGESTDLHETENEVTKNINPPDLVVEVFVPVLAKGDQNSIMKGDSGLRYSIVARSFLNVMILA